jgi:hypothetical protein
VASELGLHQGAEFRVDGGQHLGQLFHLGDRNAPGDPGIASPDGDHMHDRLSSLSLVGWRSRPVRVRAV